MHTYIPTYIHTYLHSYRTEGPGHQVLTPEQREEAQKKGDVLVKACLNYAKHINAYYFMENPSTGDLKDRPLGVFIKTSTTNDKTRDSAISGDSLIRTS